LFKNGDAVHKKYQEIYLNDPYKNLDGNGESIIVRSDLYVIVDTLHHFVNLIIIKTVSYDINF